MIVSWVDGGLPFSISSPRVASAVSSAPGASASTSGRASSPSSTPVASAFRRKIGVPTVRIPAGRNEAAARVPAQWVTGWSFEPGDPLITAATFSLADGTMVGNWVAGDLPVTLPSNSAIRVSSSLRVRLERRAPADYEQPYKARASVLRLVTQEEAPARRAWIERLSCGSPWTGRPAELLAVRPSIERDGSARVWLERAGAPKNIRRLVQGLRPALPAHLLAGAAGGVAHQRAASGGRRVRAGAHARQGRSLALIRSATLRADRAAPLSWREGNTPPRRRQAAT